MLTSLDPSRFVFVYNKVPCPGGYGKDTFINIEFRSDLADMIVGMDGEVMPVLNRDQSATVTISLLPNADYNGFLTSQLIILQNRLVTPVPVPLQIDDLNGHLVASSSGALIMKPPPRTVDQAGSNLEWTFICGKMWISYVGGGVTPLPAGVLI